MLCGLVVVELGLWVGNHYVARGKLACTARSATNRSSLLCLVQKVAAERDSGRTARLLRDHAACCVYHLVAATVAAGVA